MKHICVFCGSSLGVRPEYVQAAKELGQVLASRQITLVYGGARIGTMGQIADAALAAGGQVIGVIPESLAHHVAHPGLTELRVVGTMHERKALMAEMADAFITLPGGLGTFEEFFEIVTWAQLNMHHKPSGLLDVCGYYQPLMTFLDHAVTQRFLKPEHRAMILLDDNPERLLDQFETYRPPTVKKWVD